jgi:PAS domain-containing protein
VQAANRELAQLNQQLQTLLNAQREHAPREAGSREAAQQVLDAVLVPVFGLDDAGRLVFANPPAQALCARDADLPDGAASEQLPQALRPALDGDPMPVTLSGHRWWAMSRRLGGNTRGRLLLLLPQAGASE